jgi:hypothetical protein
MKGSSDIRRRDYHDKFLFVRVVEDVVSIGVEELLLFPP